MPEHAALGRIRHKEVFVKRDEGMTKGVAAVVVTYNRRALLARCIESLLNQTWPDMDIWVIDNASTDIRPASCVGAGLRICMDHGR